ncbi:LuxR family transcriptional regulator [Thalassobius vesicularis]|uniref:LuxR family transcriptional regulator n=1 Tax=Thalassobius vesicularis TaxID=1294297 RepID=A0A4V3UZ32_9RHOB|nr:LuxR family transcriptional regulator [Thalassobius vesicularis]THD74622.1 LuxR family transcriptional regulator [Thalassobius vesicularis]
MRAVDLAAIPDGAGLYGQMLDALCRDLGFDHASYATISPVTGDIFGHATYPAEWKAIYLERGYHLIDPTLSESAQCIAPVEWSRFDRNARFHTVFSEAAAFGITPQGLSIPIRGPFGDYGLLSVTSACAETDWANLVTASLGELQLRAVRLHDQVQNSSSLHSQLARPVLSSREVEILQWIASGKSQQDVGDILSISHRTVEVHLRSSREKLGALTTAQAIGRAIGFGMIQPR